MCSGLDEWGQVEDFIMPRQTDSLSGQEGSMTCPTPRKKKKNTTVYVWQDLPLKFTPCVCVCVNTQRCGSGAANLKVHLLKMCSCKCNSVCRLFCLFMHTFTCHVHKVCIHCEWECVFQYVSFSEGNYSVSSVGVWLMRFWSKGSEHRCPGFGPEAQLLIWGDHLYSLYLTLLRLYTKWYPKYSSLPM